MQADPRQLDLRRALVAEAKARDALAIAARQLVTAGVPAGATFKLLAAEVTLATVNAQGLVDPGPTRRARDEALREVRALEDATPIDPAPVGGLVREMEATKRDVAGLRPRRGRLWPFPPRRPH